MTEPTANGNTPNLTGDTNPEGNLSYVHTMVPAAKYYGVSGGECTHR